MNPLSGLYIYTVSIFVKILMSLKALYFLANNIYDMILHVLYFQFSRIIALIQFTGNGYIIDCMNVHV